MSLNANKLMEQYLPLTMDYGIKIITALLIFLLEAGVLILIFRPFKIGDFIEAAGQAGVVGEIKVFSTHMTTPDNKKIIVPNSAIRNGSIVNYSAKEKRRVDLLIGVSYDAYLPDEKNCLKKLFPPTHWRHRMKLA